MFLEKSWFLTRWHSFWWIWFRNPLLKSRVFIFGVPPHQKLTFFQDKYFQCIRYNNLKRFRGLQIVFEDITLVLPCPNYSLFDFVDEVALIFMNFGLKYPSEIKNFHFFGATSSEINFFQEKCFQFIRYNKLKRFRSPQMVFEGTTLVLPSPINTGLRMVYKNQF